MLEALATVSSLAFMAVIDFMLAYFGGDCSKNSELTRLLRVRLDPEIKDPADAGKDRAAVMFIHHTNKPPDDRDLREDWGTDQFAAYIGAGRAEIGEIGEIGGRGGLEQAVGEFKRVAPDEHPQIFALPRF